MPSPRRAPPSRQPKWRLVFLVLLIVQELSCIVVHAAFDQETCQSAMFDADGDRNGHLAFSEYVNMMLAMTPYPECPNRQRDFSKFLRSGGPFVNMFKELACLCESYVETGAAVQNVSCCAAERRSLALPGVYPEEYTVRVCTTLTSVMETQCGNRTKTAAAPSEAFPKATDAPTNIPSTKPTNVPTSYSEAPSATPSQRPSTASPSVDPTTPVPTFSSSPFASALQDLMEPALEDSTMAPPTKPPKAPSRGTPMESSMAPSMTIPQTPVRPNPQAPTVFWASGSNSEGEFGLYFDKTFLYITLPAMAFGCISLIACLMCWCRFRRRLREIIEDDTSKIQKPNSVRVSQPVEYVTGANMVGGSVREPEPSLPVQALRRTHSTGASSVTDDSSIRSVNSEPNMRPSRMALLVDLIRLEEEEMRRRSMSQSSYAAGLYEADVTYRFRSNSADMTV